SYRPNSPLAPRPVGIGRAPAWERIRRGSHTGLPRRKPTDGTRHLRFDQVANLVNAVAFANHEGHRLTVAIYLEWAHVAGFREDRLSEMTTRLLDRLVRWLQRHGKIELRAVWTRERGYKKGHHINIMANIPVGLIPKLKDYLIRTYAITGEVSTFNLEITV